MDADLERFPQFIKSEHTLSSYSNGNTKEDINRRIC